MAAEDQSGPRSVRAAVAVIAGGVLVTGLGWPGLIGRLPFGLFFKNQLHRPAQDVAQFWAVGSLAWYLKPAVGLLVDAFPLLGTRRRAYLIWGSVACVALWLAFLVVPRSYPAFMAVMVALNVAMVVVSVVVGGILVEAGQRHGATGRLSSLRQGLDGVMNLVVGPLGGWLASRAFGLTPLFGALVMLSFVPLAALLYPEPRRARRDSAMLPVARDQLRNIMRSPAMWWAAGLLFLVYVAPGFNTALLYYQQDVLHFDAQFIGVLQLLGGVGALAGAAAYGVYCRRLPLRATLVLGIVGNVLFVLLYLTYTSKRSAAMIDTLGGVATSIGALPLFDLAARATPKGSESFGYALLLSVYNIAVFLISDPLGSYLYGHMHVPWRHLVWINAAASAVVLPLIAFVPRAVLGAREGEPATPVATASP